MSTFKHCQPSKMSATQFLTHFLDIYEHSPWIIKTCLDEGISTKDDEIEYLHQRLASVVMNATYDQQLALILAHPDLAGKTAKAGLLTDASTCEQSSAGLNQCTEKEFEHFHQLNNAYKAKFDIPFIMAIKGKTKEQIFANYDKRIANNKKTEFNNALEQINQIAKLRLKDK